MPCDQFTRTWSSSERSLNCGRSSRFWPISGAGSGTPLNSTPLATSSPPTATPTIGHSTLLASTSMSPSSPRGGCIIVDSTRKGKRFPDGMSKTIPIRMCVLNRAIVNCIKKMHGASIPTTGCSEDMAQLFPTWDCSLHLPLWVPETEKAAIEDRLEGWTKQLETFGADITSLASSLEKPLQPLWISPKTIIWLNEVPDHRSWDFTPIILVLASSSSSSFLRGTTSEFSWNYISGAGDDEKSWSRGLSPTLFWNYAHEIINAGPNLCNQKVADIV